MVTEAEPVSYPDVEFHILDLLVPNVSWLLLVYKEHTEFAQTKDEPAVLGVFQKVDEEAFYVRVSPLERSAKVCFSDLAHMPVVFPAGLRGQVWDHNYLIQHGRELDMQAEQERMQLAGG